MRVLGGLCVTQFALALFILGLLMISQLGLVLADDGSFVTHWSGCGRDGLSYLESSDGCYFFINGRMVDHVLFCTALKFHIAGGCFSCPLPQEDGWRRIGERYCSQNFSDSSCHVESNSLTDFTFPLAMDLPRIAGRKLLMQLSANASILNVLSSKVQSHEEKYHEYFNLAPENMALAVPGMFFLCCALLCPCFRAKRKEVTEHAVLDKDPSSLGSVSSIEVSSPSERILATPLRVPPSPYRSLPSPSRFSLSPQLSRVGPIHLSISQVIKATQNFSPSLLIGEGGFGTVYKAELPGGQVVAIKRARKEQFAALRTEFRNEVELLAKFEHRNLVKLLGYIDKGNERIIITEYVPNGTLREHLDGQHGKILDFNQRLEIAIDVAHALTYLHLYAEKPIIHRDVKSSNILLTESMRAKVADFGFARAVPTDSEKTHISTKVKGTAGYLDPEYLRTYQLTPKSDVYSFGILLVEILSGRRPVEIKRAANERITVRWAFRKYTEDNVGDIMDPLLDKVIDGEILSKLFDLAFQSAAPTRSDRPAMKEVVEKLWEIRKEYGRSLGKD